MKTGVNALGWLLGSAAVAVAGGGGELQDYDLPAAAARMLVEYERMNHEGFVNMERAPDPEAVVERTRRWLDRSEALRDDPAAYHYLRARIEYDAYNQLADTATAEIGRYLDRALGQIRIFADEKVALADGHALHGAILGQMIAASPASALLHARAAKRATTTALELDPDNQLAHLNLAFTFANAPEAFGGDRKLAVEHFRRAFARGALPLRAVAGTWLSVTYDQLGDSARAAEVIEQVLELAPGFPQAQATARALADGADPVVYMQRLQNRAE